MDEYIRTKFGVVLDDDIYSLLVKKILSRLKFVGINDTCHSNSMFDLTFPISPNSENYNCLSVGACGDNELENCDGETTGFNGALTVQLLESTIDGKFLLEYMCNFPNERYLI
jgi:hypothetical protein